MDQTNDPSEQPIAEMLTDIPVGEYSDDPLLEDFGRFHIDSTRGAADVPRCSTGDMDILSLDHVYLLSLTSPASLDSSNELKGMSGYFMAPGAYLTSRPTSFRSTEVLPAAPPPGLSTGLSAQKVQQTAGTPIESSASGKSGPGATAAVASTADHNEEEIRPPEYAPYDDPNPYTSENLPLEMNADDAGRALTAALKDMPNVDFELKPLQAKWKCSFADDCLMVIFIVRIWRRNSLLMLESERRSGDSAPFYKIHREIVSRVKNPDMAESAQASLRWNLVAAPLPMPLHLSSPTTPSVAQADDIIPFIGSLKSMVESGQPEAMLEGTRALAQLSAEGQVSQCRDILCQAKVVKALITMLEVHKPSATFGQMGNACEFFAVTCLANMAMEPTAREQIQPAATFLLEKVSDGEYLDRAMRREAARAVSLLSQDDIGILGENTVEIFLRTEYKLLKDPQMREHAGIMKANFDRRWQSCQ